MEESGTKGKVKGVKRMVIQITVIFDGLFSTAIHEVCMFMRINPCIV
jgi:hypothetical protein